MTKETEWLTGPDGKQYQKSAVYEFSANGEHWVVDKLECIAAGYPHGELGGAGKYIRECQAPIGEIKAPEIVPEDGCWYLCLTNEDFGSFEAVMRWDSEFFNLGHHAYGSSTLKIIKKVDV